MAVAVIRSSPLGIEHMEERLRGIEGGGNYDFVDMIELCLVADVVIPSKFKVSDKRQKYSTQQQQQQRRRTWSTISSFLYHSSTRSPNHLAPRGTWGTLYGPANYKNYRLCTILLFCFYFSQTHHKVENFDFFFFGFCIVVVLSVQLDKLDKIFKILGHLSA